LMKRDTMTRDAIRRDAIRRDRRSVSMKADKPLSTHQSLITTHAVAVLLAAALGGCGVETATTAATGASIKKQEVEEGKRTQERAGQRIEQMQEQMQQRAQQAADK
jgi:hypothetical protein